MVLYIPILTTLFSAFFFIEIYNHWKSKKSSEYLFWWSMGIAVYGLGTLTESIVSVFGWSAVIFKLWYIFGALMGGVVLAEGSIHLLLKKNVARNLDMILITVLSISVILVILSPLDYSQAEAHRLTGRVLKWQFVRLITPFINSYAFIFLVGGAFYSGIIYFIRKKNIGRMVGNICIAIGATLPGVGGAFTKFGHTEVLYVTEFIGLILIYTGYKSIKVSSTGSIHEAQAQSVEKVRKLES